jgi:hypothetical protein
MNFWTRFVDNPLTFMSADVPFGPRTRYDMAKIIDVETPNVDAANVIIDRIRQTDYNLLKQNCLTDAVEVLQAFGVTGIPGGARPSGVFGAEQGTIVPLVASWPTPDFALDVSLYEQPKQFGIRTDVNAETGVLRVEAFADRRQDEEVDAPQPVISSVLVRRGFFVVYPENSFKGQPVVVPQGSVFNVQSGPWADPTIRSWCGCDRAFDPAASPVQM